MDAAAAYAIVTSASNERIGTPVTDKTRIDELKATGRLPSPTGVALAVLHMTQDSKTTIDQLADVLKGDPALSGRILKFANSAFAGTRRPAVAVSEAAVRIGFRKVSQLALGFSLLSSYRSGPCRAFDYDGFWSECIATAASARALSHVIRATSSEEAFSFGLLSQIGRLAFATVHPHHYSKVLQNVTLPYDETLCHLEREAFALDHNQLTGAMLEDWGLPAAFADATRCQDNPERSELPPDSRELKLATLLHISQHMSMACRTDDATRAMVIPALYAHGNETGLDADALAAMFEAVGAEWQEWGKVLGITTKQVTLGATTPAAASAAQDKASAEPEMHDAGRMRILAVDDDPSVLEFIAALLTYERHSVQTAPDAETALRKTLEFNPHLIITDWMMPGMNGLQLCRTLRQSEQTKSIYIVMLTACEDESHLVEAFDAGVDDHVVKPVNTRAFLARVRAARRIVNLQEQVSKDKDEIKHYAAELSVANRRLEQAALTDPLTELANRRYALDRLEQEWSTAVRHNRPLSCMIIDIDHFKSVNDAHGHDVGDQVLKQTAHVLRENVRRGDVVCRFGGEEFLVICKDTDAEGIATVAEHVRVSVEESTFEAEGIKSRVLVSIGVATRTEQMPSFRMLLKAADRALYAAKQAGRNRVCVAQA